jgi:hypothetical protein
MNRLIPFVSPIIFAASTMERPLAGCINWHWLPLDSQRSATQSATSPSLAANATGRVSNFAAFSRYEPSRVRRFYRPESAFAGSAT